MPGGGLQSALSASIALPGADNVVIGVERVIDESGATIADNVIQAGAPDEVCELVESGGTGPGGVQYSSVAGAYGDGATEFRYHHIQTVLPQHDVPRSFDKSILGDATPPPTEPAIEEKVAALAKGTPPESAIRVHVTLRATPTVSIAPPAAVAYASVAGASNAKTERAMRVAARTAESEKNRAAVMSLLEEAGATDIYTFRMRPDVIATVPQSARKALLSHPDVLSVSTDSMASKASDTHWDGADLKDSGGTDTGWFIDLFYQGDKTNPWHGRYLTAAVMDFDSFNASHRGFADWFDGPSRVREQWNCTASPCQPGIPTPPAGTDHHGTRVAQIVAGDLRDGQWGGAYGSDWKLQRTGQAEESELIFLETPNSTAMARALDKTLSDLDVDVISSSILYDDDLDCNGATLSSLHLWAREAYNAGLL